MESKLNPGWRKSSYSGNGGASCVEIGNATPGVVVRDTKDRAGTVLPIPVEAWKEFIAAVQRLGLFRR